MQRLEAFVWDQLDGDAKRIWGRDTSVQVVLVVTTQNIIIYLKITARLTHHAHSDFSNLVHTCERVRDVAGIELPIIYLSNIEKFIFLPSDFIRFIVFMLRGECGYESKGFS